MALSDSDILSTVKLAGPMTTASLSETLGITRQGARRRLAQLADAGLLLEEREKRGVGRPSALWSLTASGHARFPDGHADLTGALIEEVKALFGNDAVERLIAQRERTQATRYRAALDGSTGLESRLATLAALRTKEGYMAAVERQDDGSFLLTESHCPIYAAAQACQGFCRSELSLFKSLLSAGASIERCRHLLSGGQRCAYRVTPLQR
ncbi:MAG: helix-turn-helix domain-containing protein [Rhodospirillales bacterium]|nr:helix-turn-helix domain-containing protein [Rhodospirillales bacterium]